LLTVNFEGQMQKAFRNDLDTDHLQQFNYLCAEQQETAAQQSPLPAISLEASDGLTEPFLRGGAISLTDSHLCSLLAAADALCPVEQLSL
jgi:hypothetical protein